MPVRRRVVIPAAVPRRLLIIKPSSLGDVAATLPLLCDLKRLYPQSRIDWLIAPAFADLLKGHDAINELIWFERRGLAHWWLNPRHSAALFSLVRQLRRKHYDLVFDAQGLLRSALLGWLSGAPRRIGFADAREGAAWWYTDRVNVARSDHLAVIRMRRLLGPLGEAATPAEFRVPIQAQARGRMQARLVGNHPLAALIPGARWPAKCWAPAGYAQIAGRLIEAGYQVALVGSVAETALCQAVLEQTNIGLSQSSSSRGNPPLNLAGQTTLAELIALLSRCHIVIGNDTGPLHVAAALGRPLVGLYGPTAASSVGPYGQTEHVLCFGQPGAYRAAAPDPAATLAKLPVDAVWATIQSCLSIR